MQNYVFSQMHVTTIAFWLFTGSALPHLRLDVCIVVILKQQRGGLRVVFTGCDVQRWEADLPLGVVLQQQRDHRVVALLESNSQWSEAILDEKKGNGVRREY